jgi:hypothetical protein
LCARFNDVMVELGHGGCVLGRREVVLWRDHGMTSPEAVANGC